MAVRDQPAALRIYDEQIDASTLFKRAAWLLIGGVSLYILAPTLLEVFSSWDTLGRLQPGWLMLIGVAQ